MSDDDQTKDDAGGSEQPPGSKPEPVRTKPQRPKNVRFKSSDAISFSVPSSRIMAKRDTSQSKAAAKKTTSRGKSTSRKKK